MFKSFSEHKDLVSLFLSSAVILLVGLVAAIAMIVIAVQHIGGAKKPTDNSVIQ